MRNFIKTWSVCMVYIISMSITFGQSPANDIPVADLPSQIKDVLTGYMAMLKSENLDICADKFKTIAGGSLVNPAGTDLRSGVKDYSLKKDYQNSKFYKDTLEITRVNKIYPNGQGYGESAIKGYVYKIGIAKTDPSDGIPAPVSLMVPEGHPNIKDPKVVNIGSL